MKLFQITEEDLAVLESSIPPLTEAIGPRTNNADRVKIRRIKEILSNVRWNYQPHTNISEFPADGPLPDPAPPKDGEPHKE